MAPHIPDRPMSGRQEYKSYRHNNSDNLQHFLFEKYLYLHSESKGMHYNYICTLYNNNEYNNM